MVRSTRHRAALAPRTRAGNRTSFEDTVGFRGSARAIRDAAKTQPSGTRKPPGVGDLAHELCLLLVATAAAALHDTGHGSRGRGNVAQPRAHARR